jgi:hypothetical protein
MKLNEVERRQNSKMREVSDLRTQFQCDYRLHLKQKLGESLSEVGVTGSILHKLISEHSISLEDNGGNRIVPLLIIIMTLMAGIFWILW